MAKMVLPMLNASSGQPMTTEEMDRSPYSQGIRQLAEILARKSPDQLVAEAARPVLETSASRVTPRQAVQKDRLKLPLLMRLRRTPVYGQVGIADADLSARERKILVQWARSNFPIDPHASLRPSVLLRALLSSKLSRGESEPVVGGVKPPASAMSSLDALVELGLLTPVARKVLEVVAGAKQQRRAPNLSRVHFHYNGHTTEAMFPLFPTLNAAGLARGSLNGSSFSGTGPMALVMNLSVNGSAHHQGTYNDAYVKEVLERSARQAAAAGHTLIVDKGGPLAHSTDETVLRMIEEGTIRFVVHNSDDLAALQELKKRPCRGPGRGGATLWDRAHMLDLAGAPLKAVEARFIGEENALFAAREVRERWGERVGDHPVYVVGFGLLGQGIADAFARLGMPREQVVIIDDDPKKRALAASLGFSVDDEQRPRPRPARAVAFVATNGAGLSAERIARLADESMIFGVSSAGKGVDLAKLIDGGAKDRVVSERVGALSFDPVARIFADHELTVGRGKKAARALIIAEGAPLNLIEEHWQDRYSVTSAVVTMAVQELAALQAPGGLVAMNPERQAAVEAVLRAEHTLDLRPLDARSGTALERQLLAADLADGFRPRMPVGTAR